jgi:hypothetical protein
MSHHTARALDFAQNYPTIFLKKLVGKVLNLFIRKDSFTAKQN